MAVYLLHFDRPDGQRRHYLGYTSRDPETRLREHLRGVRGKPSFTGKLISQGFVPRIAHVWPDANRTFEKRLKLLSRAIPRFQFKNWCPCCHAHPVFPTEFEIMNWKQVAGMALAE